MKATTLLYSSVLLLTIVSCKKKEIFGLECQTSECYTISGFVFDDSTDLPIDSAYVTLRAPQGIFRWRQGATYTDENGYWELNIDREDRQRMEDAELEISAENYFGFANNFPLGDEDINNPKTTDARLVPAGEITFKVNVTDQKIDRLKVTHPRGEKLVSTQTAKWYQFSLKLVANVPSEIDFEYRGEVFQIGFWKTHPDFPAIYTLDFGQKDTIEIEL